MRWKSDCRLGPSKGRTRKFGVNFFASATQLNTRLVVQTTKDGPSGVGLRSADFSPLPSEAAGERAKVRDLFCGVWPSAATASSALSRVVEGSIANPLPSVAAPGDGRTPLTTDEKEEALLCRRASVWRVLPRPISSARIPPKWFSRRKWSHATPAF